MRTLTRVLCEPPPRERERESSLKIGSGEEEGRDLRSAAVEREVNVAPLGSRRGHVVFFALTGASTRELFSQF